MSRKQTSRQRPDVTVILRITGTFILLLAGIILLMAVTSLTQSSCPIPRVRSLTKMEEEPALTGSAESSLVEAAECFEQLLLAERIDGDDGDDGDNDSLDRAYPLPKPVQVMVVATCYCRECPAESYALLSVSSVEGAPRWVRNGEQLGGILVERIADGKVGYRHLNHEAELLHDSETESEVRQAAGNGIENLHRTL